MVYFKDWRDDITRTKYMSTKKKSARSKKKLVCPRCPDGFDWRFGKKLIKYLGGDPSLVKDDWCWEQFAKTYPELIKRAEEYFEEATTGNPSFAAYKMVYHCNSKREWAEHVIENDTVGYPVYAAWRMVYYCNSSRTWAEKIDAKWSGRHEKTK